MSTVALQHNDDDDGLGSSDDQSLTFSLSTWSHSNSLKAVAVKAHDATSLCNALMTNVWLSHRLSMARGVPHVHCLFESVSHGPIISYCVSFSLILLPTSHFLDYVYWGAHQWWRSRNDELKVNGAEVSLLCCAGAAGFVSSQLWLKTMTWSYPF